MEQAEAPPPAAATRPVPAQAPAGAWPTTSPHALAAELDGAPWTLVEFWAPDNLFGRLMAPIRRQLPASHGQRLRLLCCVVADAEQLRACAPFKVVALPELVLYRGRRWARRWRGAVDVQVLRADIDGRMRREPA